MYEYTFSQYKFIELENESVALALKEEPYAGIIVQLGQDVIIHQDENGQGTEFQYRIIGIPDGFDVSKLNTQEFTDYLGNILRGQIERHYAKSNTNPDDGSITIPVDMEADNAEDPELVPTTVEYDARTGTTTINYA